MFYNKKKLKIIESELNCYKSDYNHLREIVTTLFNKNQEQQQVIDIAIDYIKNGGIWYEDKESKELVEKELLEILGDKENE